MASNHTRPKIKIQKFPPPQTDYGGNNSEYEDVAAPQRPPQMLKRLKDSNASLRQRIKYLETDLKHAQITGQETSEKLAKSVAFNQEKAAIIERKDAKISTIREENETQKSNIDDYKKRIYEIEKELQETTIELDKQIAFNRNSSLSHEIDKMRLETEKLREYVTTLTQKVDELNKQLMYKDAMWKEEQERNEKERANINFKIDNLLGAFQTVTKQNEEYRIKKDREDEEYRIRKEREDTKRHDSLRQAIADRQSMASPVLPLEQRQGQVLAPIVEGKRTGQNVSRKSRSTLNVADIPNRRVGPNWSYSTVPTHTRPGSEKK